MDIIQEMRELDREPDTPSVALTASATARTTTSVSARVIAVNHTQNTNIVNSNTLTKKASSSSLTSNISKTYYNTTTSVVTRKRGGLAIAIKRQDSLDPYGNNNNHDRSISRQSSYSIPSTPVTPPVPTLRRGLSVRISEASTAICVGNDDNATEVAAVKRQPLTCLERFREGILRFFAKIMGSRTPSEADGYDYYDCK
ncbi:uncharacterized protein LOC125778401 [Bactrocera dorsalis]|uniref:Uncharacterized protein LOC125778401 n=1 Tax=Bactrocera dorsalis TaxID=27457 RepID=A0ABM3JR54_BACDO|nr:uncharacterized protein LOC125778401 [Bactrocera dorsalis]